MSNKKRNQHYVWRYYLQPWLSEEKRHCLRDNKIFSTNPINIGQQRDFYKLKELTPKDFAFIQANSYEQLYAILKRIL